RARLRSGQPITHSPSNSCAMSNLLPRSAARLPVWRFRAAVHGLLYRNITAMLANRKSGNEPEGDG
ncbi:MAG: hypothetical protein OXU81_08525, partial [Gammaproteobacteria bacterium]|nr:hypothetical protein [Gammaproteobacteria bacterium]